MAQLSDSDYGPSDFTGDADWEAHSVFVVEDNVTAEHILHQHFGDSRLENSRELFYTDDPELLVEEARALVDGTYVGEVIEGADAVSLIAELMDVAFSASAVAFSVHALFPNEKTEQILNRKS